jgi:hypothetical protein
VITSSINECRIRDKNGNLWQYNSRSDRHSKIACVAIALDLLAHSSVLRRHAAKGQVVVGINHEMRDFRTGRKKDLDLVIATPGTQGESPGPKPSLRDLIEKYGLILDPTQTQLVMGLPNPSGGEVGAVRLALEAKACMTAFTKARPRLYDELTSSHLTVHGASDAAIAGGFVMVNMADEFISSVSNPNVSNKIQVNRHNQPQDAQGVLEKLHELPRRTVSGSEGFDALGILVVNMRNDGGSVNVVTADPAPAPSSLFHYDQMIRRLGQLYDTKYAGS